MHLGVATEARETARVTLEAWADMDEDEPGELVDGWLEEEEMPSFLHEAIVAWLMRVLGVWANANGSWVFGSETKLGVSPHRGRKPDLCVYLKGAEVPGRRASMARTPPSIVVEVLSPRPRDGRRDRVDKRHDYARFGVRFYWLIDPELKVIEIFELGEDTRYTLALSAATGSYPVPGCEGLVLDLDALWADVDRLPDTPEEESGEP
jgi:Uma2 family endonuclease